MVDGEPLILHVYATVCMLDQRARTNELVTANPRQSATAPLGSRSACRSSFLCRLHAWSRADGACHIGCVSGYEGALSWGEDVA